MLGSWKTLTWTHTHTDTHSTHTDPIRDVCACYAYLVERKYTCVCLFLPASSVSHWASLFRDLLQVCFAVYLVLDFVAQRLAVRKFFSSVKVSFCPSVVCVYVNVEITPTCACVCVCVFAGTIHLCRRKIRERRKGKNGEGG